MKKLCVIIPTYNERENIPILVKKITDVLQGIDYEIIVADDNSPDGTWQIAEELQSKYPRLKCLRRVGRRGLASAVYESALLADARYFAVIDADMQHDETVLTAMLKTAEKGAHVVVGSRYIKGSGTSNWSKTRLFISKIGTVVTNILLPHRHDITDPMSGFYLMERRLLVNSVDKLTGGKGFRSLLDIISTYMPSEIIIKEVPYVFKSRMHGESKITTMEALQYLGFLYEKRLGKYIPLTFIKFCIVGSTGAIIHFSILYIFFKLCNLKYQYSLVIAFEIALIFNFIFNNRWTFKDKKIRGIRIIWGYIKYNFANTFGGAINFIISNYLILNNLHWVVSSFIGAFAGVLWNYILSKIITWKDVDN
jgi:dolichol-phosphate mannosyltransferase